MPNNELYHYGVPGMRWGVRRYQNEDGTLTSAGKRRQKYAKVEKAVDTVKRIARSGESEVDRQHREKREQEANQAGRMHKRKDTWEENGNPFPQKKSVNVTDFTTMRELAKRGKQAATQVYVHSREVFNTAAMSAAASRGSAWASALLDVGAVAKKYREPVEDSWASKTARHPATKTDGAGTNGSVRDRLKTVGKTDGWGAGTSAAEDRLRKNRMY